MAFGEGTCEEGGCQVLEKAGSFHLNPAFYNQRQNIGGSTNDHRCQPFLLADTQTPFLPAEKGPHEERAEGESAKAM